MVQWVLPSVFDTTLWLLCCQEAVPTWGDRHDILSLLRACNYDPDECISIYMHLEKDRKCDVLCPYINTAMYVVTFSSTFLNDKKHQNINMFGKRFYVNDSLKNL